MHSSFFDVPIVLVGTYHKTGTVWLKDIFERIAAETGRGWINISDLYRERENVLMNVLESAENGSIFFDYHTQFPKIESVERYRGLRMVRDPRDVLLSAERYHRSSSEEWLHIPYSCFNGKTFQETLNSIKNLRESIRFEMEAGAGSTIRQMLEFKNDRVFRTVKYEKMILDSNMIEWLNIFVFLGFRGEELPKCLLAVWENSLFGGKVSDSEHILDGSVQQWRSAFTDEIMTDFERAFPYACASLGYD